MTNQKLNEAVAEVLGLTQVPGYPLKYVEYRRGETEFSPATDPAAALWSLKRLGCSWEIRGGGKRYSVQIWRNDGSRTSVTRRGESFEETICRAIVVAEK